MLTDLNSLSVALSVVFLLTICVLVVVVVLTRAGRPAKGGRMWDEMNHVRTRPLDESVSMRSASGTWPPPSEGLDRAAGRSEQAPADAAGSQNVSNLLPL